VRNRRDVANRHHADAGVVNRADCRFASAARTFNAHFALSHSGFHRFASGFAGGLLRGERCACATKLPSVSVIEISVLLKVAEITTIPEGIFFLSFLRKAFFLPAVFAAAFATFQLAVISQQLTVCLLMTAN
jgi:hypothetical protein